MPPTQQHSSNGRGSSTGSGSGGSGGNDIFQQLFGPGSLARATGTGSSKPKNTSSGTKPPLCVKLGAAALGVWGGGEALGPLVAQIPGGASRDALRGLLAETISYSPAAAAVLGGGSAVSGWWLYRSKRRGSEAKERRRREPTAADRAAAIAMKVTPGTVMVTPKWKIHPPWPRPRSVTVTYPGGAAQENPGRAIAKALAVVYGQELAPVEDSWRPHKGKLKLRPGPLPPEPDPAPPPEASEDPVERAKDVVESMLGKAAESTHVQVEESHEDGTAKEFVVRHGTTPKMGVENNRAALSSTLSDMLPDARGGRGWKVVVEPTRNRIRFIDQKAMPTKILRPLVDLTASFGNQLILPVGQDEDENLLGFDAGPSTIQPHGLIVGPTGTGKTSLIRSVIVAASHHRMEMWGADPKRIEMLGFSDWPGFVRLAVDVSSMAALIRDAYKEMFDRYKKIEKRQIRRSQLEPMLVILDEYLILRSMLIYEHKLNEGRGQPPELGMLTEMLALARSARVHLLLGVQRPDAELFDMGSRDNLRFRVSLGQLSGEGAGMLWDDRSVGTRPTGINGRGVATGLNGMPVDMQAWWTPSLSSHSFDREDMSAAERDRIDALRPPEWAAGSWSTTASGLHVPDGDDAAARGNTPRGGAEEALADVVDVIPARKLEDGMRVKMEDSTGDPCPATVEQVDEDGDDVVVDLRWDNGAPEQRCMESSEDVWLLEAAPQPV